jgi:hypothetical protein
MNNRARSLLFVVIFYIPVMFAFRTHLLGRIRTTNARPMTSLLLFMSTETKQTLAAGTHVSEMEVKKSRFVGYSKHVESWDQAQSFIKEVKSEHPKARHWCYAMKTGWNPVQERCSDDGEPTGTAGVPILGEATVHTQSMPRKHDP